MRSPFRRDTVNRRMSPHALDSPSVAFPGLGIALRSRPSITSRGALRSTEPRFTVACKANLQPCKAEEKRQGKPRPVSGPIVLCTLFAEGWAGCKTI